MERKWEDREGLSILSIPLFVVLLDRDILVYLSFELVIRLIVVRVFNYR